MPEQRNKEYQKIRNWLVLVRMVLTLLVLLGAIVLDLTGVFHRWAERLVSNSYGLLFFYFFFFSVYSLLITFPLSFYSGFVLEHRYQLSDQKFEGWLWMWTKSVVLSFVLMAPLVLVLYALIWTFETSWWFLAWLGYTLFSLILGKLFPVLIVPLFYRYSPIRDDVLKKRIEQLATRYGFAIQNVCSLNLSKTTKKANAMFTGFGKTRRVVLGDTLLDSFSQDEILSVVGHELGHCRHRDIWKQFGFGAATTLFGFWIAFRLLEASAVFRGYLGASDVRAFPLLCLIFFIFELVLSPLGNAFSRRSERRADQFALAATRNQAAFISAMTKLGETNLADPEPHPIIEFLLYDHPAIGKRIKMGEQFVSK